MHEMSMAQYVLDIAVGEMEKNAATTVRKIKLSIGELSGVVGEALEFAFDVLKPGTPAEFAEIDVEFVPLRAECEKCGPMECRLNDLNLLCPRCGEVVRISSGREMKVDYLDLD
jgi:hydrogenase nickel incorporation protein HypA/HybF